MESLNRPSGSVIYSAGDPANQAYLIQLGTVDLKRASPLSLEHEKRLGPGEVFGELSLIDEHPYSMSAIAVSDVELKILTRDEFKLLISGVPLEYTCFLQSLFHRIKTPISIAPAHSHSTALAPTAPVSSEPVEATPAPDPVPQRRIDVVINPLTRRAAATLPREGLFIESYPFRIGRAAGMTENDPKDTNDLWLKDEIRSRIVPGDVRE